jgi:hypothetical protein
MKPALPVPWLIKPAVPLIAWLTARFISHHHRRLWPHAEAIRPELREKLRPFFPADVLAATRIVCAAIPEPRFYPFVTFIGVRGWLEPSSVGAMTLIDLVAYPRRLSPSTLAHELVHVVQYRVLGLKKFADLYVRGFLDGGGYEGIPLERQAYELEERIRRYPDKAFSVEEDVIRRLEAGRL